MGFPTVLSHFSEAVRKNEYAFFVRYVAIGLNGFLNVAVYFSQSRYACKSQDTMCARLQTITVPRVHDNTAGDPNPVVNARRTENESWRLHFGGGVEVFDVLYTEHEARAYAEQQTQAFDAEDPTATTMQS